MEGLEGTIGPKKTKGKQKPKKQRINKTGACLYIDEKEPVPEKKLVVE